MLHRTRASATPCCLPRPISYTTPTSTSLLPAPSPSSTSTPLYSLSPPTCQPHFYPFIVLPLHPLWPPTSLPFPTPLSPPPYPHPLFPPTPPSSRCDISDNPWQAGWGFGYAGWLYMFSSEWYLSVINQLLECSFCGFCSAVVNYSVAGDGELSLSLSPPYSVTDLSLNPLSSQDRLRFLINRLTAALREIMRKECFRPNYIAAPECDMSLWFTLAYKYVIYCLIQQNPAAALVDSKWIDTLRVRHEISRGDAVYSLTTRLTADSMSWGTSSVVHNVCVGGVWHL